MGEKKEGEGEGIKGNFKRNENFVKAINLKKANVLMENKKKKKKKKTTKKTVNFNKIYDTENDECVCT